MDTLGTDFNNTGSVMSRKQLEEMRQKRGECITCARKLFRKKLFKMVPITEPGYVLEGRCLNCRPLSPKDSKNAHAHSSSSRATPQDLERFVRSQSNLSSRMGPSSSGSSRRNITRAASAMPRTDSRSTGSTSTASRQLIGRRAASASASRGAGEASTPPTPRQIVSPSGDSQPLPVPRQPSRASVVAGYDVQTSDDELADLPSHVVTREGSHAKRRSSHSDVHVTPPGRAAPKRNNSGDLPTPAELQKAALTLLAAKEHGIYEEVFHPEDAADINQRLNRLSSDRDMAHALQESENFSFRVEGSGRSMRSLNSSLPEVQSSSDDINDFPIPQHGVLDRGGSYPLTPPGTGSNRHINSHFVSGSNRTLSSMSSLEDEFNSGQMAGSFRGLTVPAVHEDFDDQGRHYNGEMSGQDETLMLSPEERLEMEGQYSQELQNCSSNVGELLILLKEETESAPIVQSGLEQLATLKLSADDQETLGEMGAFQTLIEIMTAHSTSLDIQSWACAAVWNMSGTTKNQLEFVEAGVLEPILGAMERFIADLDLQEKAIGTISNLGAAEGNLNAIFESDVTKRIVEAMNKHSEIVSVQVKGCLAFTNLASHESPLKQQIVESGGGGAIVVAMVMHTTDPYLQQKALRALRNLCANNEENKVELANIGGIDSVISAMQIHRDEVGVQEEGAWTLSNLAGNSANKAVIGDCGGIDVVIRAMWVHSEAVGIQEWCCRALYTLTLDPQNGDVVLEVGGISAIVNAMQAHVDSPTIQEMGCAVLGNLAGSDRSRMKIVDEEALDAIVLAMVLHTDDIQVQERACEVLLRLAIQENLNSMQAANIPELVRAAAQKFPERCNDCAGQLLNTLTPA